MAIDSNNCSADIMSITTGNTVGRYHVRVLKKWVVHSLSNREIVESVDMLLLDNKVKIET
jgi:hypothetical protein